MGYVSRSKKSRTKQAQLLTSGQQEQSKDLALFTPMRTSMTQNASSNEILNDPKHADSAFQVSTTPTNQGSAVGTVETLNASGFGTTIIINNNHYYYGNNVTTTSQTPKEDIYLDPNWFNYTGPDQEEGGSLSDSLDPHWFNYEGKN